MRLPSLLMTFLLEGLIGLSITTGVVFVFLVPAMHARQSVREELELARRSVLTSTQRIGGLSRSGDVEHLTGEVQDLRRRLKREQDSEALARDLRSAAREAGLKLLRDGRFEPARSDEHVCSFTRDLVLRGRFPGVQRFLAAVERHPAELRVEALRIVRSTVDPGEIRADVRMLWSTHRRGGRPTAAK